MRSVVSITFHPCAGRFWVYVAAFRDYQHVLTRGEQGVMMLIASDRNQARVLFGYVSALFSTPMLAPLVEKRWTDALFLRGGVSIEVATASFRSTRGFTVLRAVLDEIAYWRGTDETSANEDAEVLSALRPAMATVPGALLVGISSPYAKRGVLWQAFDRHHGKDGDALVWRAPSLRMNPSLDPQIVEEAYKADEPRARAEYGAEFRTDVEQFVSLEIARACTIPGRTELPPMRSARYVAFCDPSGGSADAFTLAVGHREHDGRIVVDALRERRAPFNPSEAVAEFSGLLKAYSVSTLVGDRYSGEWCVERFREHGIRYEPAPKPKSELYGQMLPVLNARTIELPDDPRLIAQLVGLERYTTRGGRDSIDHRRGAHDDLANSVSGLVSLLARNKITGISGSTQWGGSWHHHDRVTEYFDSAGNRLDEIADDDPQREQKTFFAERLARARR